MNTVNTYQGDEVMQHIEAVTMELNGQQQQQQRQ